MSKTHARKGQVATEFFTYAAIFLLIVLAAYFTIFFVQSSEISNKESLYVKWFGERFASSANMAMAGQRGFNYTMQFERDILGKPFTVQFVPQSGSRRPFVYIIWSQNNLTYSYPMGNLTLQPGPCIRYVPTGYYYEINSSLGELNFYNDGRTVTLSQKGCT